MQYAYTLIEHNMNTDFENPVVEYWANVYERVGPIPSAADPIIHSTEMHDANDSYLYGVARDWMLANGYTEDKLGRDI